MLVKSRIQNLVVGFAIGVLIWLVISPLLETGGSFIGRVDEDTSSLGPSTYVKQGMVESRSQGGDSPLLGLVSISGSGAGVPDAMVILTGLLDKSTSVTVSTDQLGQFHAKSIGSRRVMAYVDPESLPFPVQRVQFGPIDVEAAGSLDLQLARVFKIDFEVSYLDGSAPDSLELWYEGERLDWSPGRVLELPEGMGRLEVHCHDAVHMHKIQIVENRVTRPVRVLVPWPGKLVVTLRSPSGPLDIRVFLAQTQGRDVDSGRLAEIGHETVLRADRRGSIEFVSGTAVSAPGWEADGSCAILEYPNLAPGEYSVAWALPGRSIESSVASVVSFNEEWCSLDVVLPPSAVVDVRVFAPGSFSLEGVRFNVFALRDGLAHGMQSSAHRVLNNHTAIVLGEYGQRILEEPDPAVKLQLLASHPHLGAVVSRLDDLSSVVDFSSQSEVRIDLVWPELSAVFKMSVQVSTPAGIVLGRARTDSSCLMLVSPGTVDVSVFDSEGRVVFRQQVNVGAGSNVVVVRVEL